MLHDVSVPTSNPEVEAGDKADGIIGYKKRRVSLKQGLTGVFQKTTLVVKSKGSPRKTCM